MKFGLLILFTFVLAGPAMAKNQITITGSKADKLYEFLGAADCGAGKCTASGSVTVTCKGTRYEADGDVNKSKDNTCVITENSSEN